MGSKRKSRAKKGSAPTWRGFGAASVRKRCGKESNVVKERPVAPIWAAFQCWLADSGAITDAVSLADCDGIRGVVTTRNLQPGGELMRIPRKIILDVARADTSAVCEIWREVQPPLPGYAKLALALLQEQRLGAASDLTPYIDILPSADEFAADGGPASLWSDAELAVTECGKLIADTRQQRATIAHAALKPEALEARWTELGLAGASPRPEEIAWAVSVVTSRAYTMEQPEEGAGRAPTSGLIPMVDVSACRTRVGRRALAPSLSGLPWPG